MLQQNISDNQLHREVALMMHHGISQWFDGSLVPPYIALQFKTKLNSGLNMCQYIVIFNIYHIVKYLLCQHSFSEDSNMFITHSNCVSERNIFFSVWISSCMCSSRSLHEDTLILQLKLRQLVQPVCEVSQLALASYRSKLCQKIQTFF